jgi:hypothetical protein
MLGMLAWDGFGTAQLIIINQTPHCIPAVTVVMGIGIGILMGLVTHTARLVATIDAAMPFDHVPHTTKIVFVRLV